MGKTFPFSIVVAIWLALSPVCFAQTDSLAWIKSRLGLDTSLNEKALRLRDDVGFLSDAITQGRGCGSVGHEECAMFIMRNFRDLVLCPFDSCFTRSFFMPDSTVARNIVGIAGAGAQSYVVVGAHYDNFGIINGKIYPGADSNASGVGALLALARELKGSSICGIIFVAFDAMVQGRKGSLAFWDELSKGKLKDPRSGRTIRPSDISLMIDIDQIGSSLVPVHRNRRDYIIALGNASLPVKKQSLLEFCNGAVGLDLNFNYYGSDRFTALFYCLGDRRVFIANGIPTLYFTSGITDYNNSTLDVADRLDFDVLERRTRLISLFVDSWCGTF